MTTDSRAPAGLLRSGLPVLATLAMLAAMADAQAALVTRNVGVTLTAATFDTFGLDVDQSGSTDFTFTAAFAPDPVFALGFDTIDVPFGSSNAFVVGPGAPLDFPNVSRLLAGASVSMASLYSSFGAQGNLFSTDFVNGSVGNFNGQSGFVGLRFVGIGGATFFGFAQITVNALSAASGALDLTIGTVGFDNVAGTAVTIPGVVNGVPEPGSLALLGAAGIGLLLARRRSKTAA